MCSDIEDFTPLVRPHVLTCPPPTMERAILDAAIEFCSRTFCWRDLDMYPLEGGGCGVRTVKLLLPCSGILHRIENVWADNDRKLRPVQFNELAHEGAGVYAQTDNDQKIVVLDTPDTCNVTISAFLKPSPHAERLPDVLHGEFREPIMHGALARLMVVPGVPWGDPQLAGYHKAEFNAACDRNFAFGSKGRQRAPLRSRARYL